MTPISSPQNVAAIQAIEAAGGTIGWATWLTISIPFCTISILTAWALLLTVYRFDRSADEAARDNSGGAPPLRIPAVVFEKEELTSSKIASLIGASATLATFACAPATALLGGTPPVALTSVALALGSGAVSRQTFNSYSWHLLFLIGGGSSLGLAVRKSGLLDAIAESVKRQLDNSPWILVMELVLMLICTTTFVSHTVSALVLMPLVVELGTSAGIPEQAVVVGAFACSAACSLPISSFPNVNSAMALDDHGKPWLTVKNYLRAGIPITIANGILLSTVAYWLAMTFCH